MRDETPGARQGARENEENDGGCAFILDGPDPGSAPPNFCNAQRRPGSAYCPRHHARCRLPGGSGAERQQLREIEALAEAVGGRRGRAARQPPAPLLRRLDRLARALSHQNRSCIVLKDADGHTTDP